LQEGSPKCSKLPDDETRLPSVRKAASDNDCPVEVRYVVGLSAKYGKGIVAEPDVGWLCTHKHKLDPVTLGSLANQNCTTGCASAN
jgi:hypothetical protein